MVSTTLPVYLERIPVDSLGVSLSDVQIHTCSNENGSQRKLYRLGLMHTSHIVMLPPYGMSFLLVLRLATLLAQHFSVLIWESAGCPDGTCHVVDEDFELACQSRDFSHILKQQGITDFHFIGWCQAAQLVVYAIVTEGVRPMTMSWLGPSGFGHSLIKSEFERCALPIYLEIERRGSEEARKLAKILDKYQGIRSDEGFNSERLTMLHLVDPHSTRIFSKYMKCFEDNKTKVKEMLPAVLSTTPTQIIHCRDDTYSHYSESVQISKQFPDVKLVLHEVGGHLQVFDAPDVSANLIRSFIESNSMMPSEIS